MHKHTLKTEWIKLLSWKTPKQTNYKLSRVYICFPSARTYHLCSLLWHLKIYSRTQKAMLMHENIHTSTHPVWHNGNLKCFNMNYNIHVLIMRNNCFGIFADDAFCVFALSKWTKKKLMENFFVVCIISLSMCCVYICDKNWHLFLFLCFAFK